MFRFDKRQLICSIGGIKIGGQPGQLPPVLIGSIFQKGDRIFSGNRKRGFDEKMAEDLLIQQERISRETGIPAMVDIVATDGEEFRIYIDFVTGVTEMPFCIDAWALKPKLDAAIYCEKRGLMDRMFYNSLTLWEKELEREIREIYAIGVKHVLLIAFDPEDKMPSGRVKGLERLLNSIDKCNASFESILVDTSVMNAPATAFCAIANRMIKERWGFPTGSAPSNGSYMWKEARNIWGFRGWAGADAALEGIATTFYHDFIFYGPMASAPRIFPAVAIASAFLATMIYGEIRSLPESEFHPLSLLFRDFIDQLKGSS
jgi:tetrahydromethanopterin S-methyltransferase subunit H